MQHATWPQHVMGSMVRIRNDEMQSDYGAGHHLCGCDRTSGRTPLSRGHVAWVAGSKFLADHHIFWYFFFLSHTLQFAIFAASLFFLMKGPFFEGWACPSTVATASWLTGSRWPEVNLLLLLVAVGCRCCWCLLFNNFSKRQYCQ